ncbi:hypothetical protein [Chitinophaga sp. HK235]|uniref:hypothetical protein n=1 Tax=Chitinophaga sp. HK235 TaxID=2952571 RepID=UPI001BA8AE7D|nr:hypothetical protein [Chitinophaga sp. HK235]
MKAESTTLAAVEVVTLHSIRAQNNLPVSRKNKLLNPHQLLWTNRGSGHKKAHPVVFDISQQADNAFEVTVSSSKTLAGHYTLEAYADGGEVLFAGKVTDDNTFVAKSIKTPDEFATLRNHSLHWQLTADKQETIPLGTTWIEIFWIDTTHVPPALHQKGVILEGLHMIAEASKAITTFPYDENTKLLRANAQPIYYYVNQVFNFLPPRYDVWSGAPYFTNSYDKNSITLNYNAYTYAHNYQPNSILNCYDTATVLQYYLIGAGYPTAWLFMQPFGYLRLTNLIGRGQCNNPFYAANNTPPVIAVNDSRRTAFGNHAFINITNIARVADGCAGPHQGTETAQQYVSSAVDNQYPNPPRVRPGTVGDITSYLGLKYVNRMSSAYTINDLPHLEAFKKLLKYKEIKTLRNDKSGIAGKFPEPAECPLLHGKWKTSYEEVIPGSEEVLKIWMLNDGDQLITIKLHVISGSKELAHNRFLAIGATTQGVEPSYEAGPENLGEYSAVSVNKHYPLLLVMQDNMVLHIASSDPSVDLGGLAKWCFQQMTRSHVADISSHLPAVHLHYSSLQPKKGDRFYVSLSSGENSRLDFELEEGNGLRLISEEDTVLVFDTVKAGKQVLKVLVIDKDTLMVNTQTLTIDIQE